MYRRVAHRRVAAMLVNRAEPIASMLRHGNEGRVAMHLARHGQGLLRKLEYPLYNDGRVRFAAELYALAVL